MENLVSDNYLSENVRSDTYVAEHQSRRRQNGQRAPLDQHGQHGQRGQHGHHGLADTKVGVQEASLRIVGPVRIVPYQARGQGLGRTLV